MRKTTETLDVPEFYTRLRDYFPVSEMKDLRQMEWLIREEPVYDKLENSDYLVLYADFEEFLFIDYLLVNRDQRGTGIGARVVQRMKRSGKPILLEVEPESKTNLDTGRRIRFYNKHGFRKVPGVRYVRQDEGGKPLRMNVMYWSPTQKISDDRVLRMMKTVCHRVHNFRAKEIYGRLPAEPDKVLSLCP